MTMSENKVGRPSKMTDEVFQILEQYLKLDAPIPYACHQAGISKSTFYDYVKDNPEFSDKVDAWKADTMTAALTSEKALIQEGNPTVVTNYLNKKDKTRKDRYEGSEVITELSVDDYIKKLRDGELDITSLDD